MWAFGVPCLPWQPVDGRVLTARTPAAHSHVSRRSTCPEEGTFRLHAQREGALPPQGGAQGTLEPTDALGRQSGGLAVASQSALCPRLSGSGPPH